MNRCQIRLLQSGLRQKLGVNQLQMSLAHTPLIDEGINVNTQFDGGVRESSKLKWMHKNLHKYTFLFSQDTFF